jgi:hypothetical protein
MKSMNCRSVRREIDEAEPGDLPGSVASDHIKNCLECQTFADEHLKLQKIVASLGTVEAPGDFEFRLRARLAGEKRGSAQPFMFRNFSFGLRAAAVAAALLLTASAVLFVTLKSPSGSTVPSDSSRATNAPIRATDGNLTAGNKQSGQQNAFPAEAPRVSGTQASKAVPDVKFSSIGQRNNIGKGKPKLATVASVNEPRGLNTRDLSSTSAVVVKPSDQSTETNPAYAFPIEAPYQSLKVSLDDGRGSSRTISLPRVSFGSQRFLAQGSSPLLESSRGSW